MRRTSNQTLFALAVLPLLAAASTAPATAAEVSYVAIADVEAPNGDKLVTHIRIVVTGTTSDEERARLIEVVKAGGSAAASPVLEQLPDLGYIEIENRLAAVKYAYSQTVDKETILVVLTSKPLAFLGSRRPEAKPVAGFDLAIATLYLDSAGRGRGELSPAAKVKVLENGLVAVEDYAEKLVELRWVERK
jgi:hypothetical protein